MGKQRQSRIEVKRDTGRQARVALCHPVYAYRAPFVLSLFLKEGGAKHYALPPMEVDLGSPVTLDDLARISEGAAADAQKRADAAAAKEAQKKAAAPGKALAPASQSDIDNLLRHLGDEKEAYAFVPSYGLRTAADATNPRRYASDYAFDDDYEEQPAAEYPESIDEKVSEIREKVSDLEKSVATLDDTTIETRETVTRTECSIEQISESVHRTEKGVEDLRADMAALRSVPSDIAVLVAEFQELRSVVATLGRVLTDKGALRELLGGGVAAVPKPDAAPVPFSVAWDVIKSQNSKEEMPLPSEVPLAHALPTRSEHLETKAADEPLWPRLEPMVGVKKIFTCRKCKSDECCYMQPVLLAPDEPVFNYFRCGVCDFRWRSLSHINHLGK